MVAALHIYSNPWLFLLTYALHAHRVSYGKPFIPIIANAYWNRMSYRFGGLRIIKHSLSTRWNEVMQTIECYSFNGVECTYIRTYAHLRTHLIRVSCSCSNSASKCLSFTHVTRLARYTHDLWWMNVELSVLTRHYSNVSYYRSNLRPHQLSICIFIIRLLLYARRERERESERERERGFTIYFILFLTYLVDTLP
jgi:hypothetical protein